MARCGYWWPLVLAVCYTGYSAAPSPHRVPPRDAPSGTPDWVQLLDDELAGLFKGANSSDTGRLRKLKVLLKSHLKDAGTPQGLRDSAIVYEDCQDAYSKGLIKSDVYKIYPGGRRQMEVFCDLESSNGGWTVIQRRLDGMVNFDRSWSDYKHGFGTAASEYYLGNQNIYEITAHRKHKLRIELHHHGHGFLYAEYSSFAIGNEELKYALSVGGYTGTNSPGDSLAYHNGQRFSTRDADNDAYCDHCAAQYGAGWWYKNCSNANLNGIYGSMSEKGVTWTTWMGSTTSLTSVKMMVKPADEEVTTSTSTTPTLQPETTSGAATTSLRPETTSAAATPSLRPETTVETTSAETTPMTTSSTPNPKNCQDVYHNGGKTSGVYMIYPDNTQGIHVYCEQTIDGGGWTVFQRRIDGTVDFYLPWQDYKLGFGSVNAEHWLGNDIIHQLTKNRDQRLTVEVQHKSYKAYAKYSDFWIADENGKYKLNVGGYHGPSNNPGDALAYHNGQFYSTRDHDNDGWGSGSNAQRYGGAWWYPSGYHSSLNSQYRISTSSYFQWTTWSGFHYLTGSRMMIKPK